MALAIVGCASPPQSNQSSNNSKATPDAGVCSGPFPYAAADANEILASGSVTGPNLNALVCGISVSLDSDGAGGFVCNFGWQGTTLVDFKSPPAATPALIQADIGVSAAVPGTYSASDESCGFVTFNYTFPVVPSSDCSGTTIPCPAGCAPRCADGTCNGCVQFQSRQGFQANGASTCLLGAFEKPAGSWTLTLAGVTPAGQGYTVHGSLFATLVDQLGTDSASLALAF